jgi:hypothetical protein
MNDEAGSIEAPLAQAPFNQSVYDHFPAPAIVPVDCDGFPHAGFEGSQPAIAPIGHDDALRAAPALPSKQARAAWRLGKRLIRRLRTGKATNLAARSARLIKPKAANPIRAARARAVHSHAAHGGSRKAGDDGDGGDRPAPQPQQGCRETFRRLRINRAARRRALREGSSRPSMMARTADPLAALKLAKAAKEFEAETREMSWRLGTPDPYTFFDPYRKFQKLATQPALKGRILVLAGMRGRPGHLDIDWLYARHSRALAILTIGKRRAFVEAVKANPRAAAQSDEVDKARRAFASAMTDARERDRAATRG